MWTAGLSLGLEELSRSQEKLIQVGLEPLGDRGKGK